MLEHYFSLAIKAIFVENMALAFFLGMCSFLAVSKKVETAIGLGGAVMFVLAVTCPLNWAVYNFLLREGALAWTGVEQLAVLDLSFLTFLALIGSIAASVQIVEMTLDKYLPALYAALGIFLPLIAVNCAILGAALNGIEDGVEPPDPITGNAYAQDLPRIPDTWGAAIEAFEASKVMPRIFPEELIRNMLLTKRQELHYMAELEPHEQVEIYLDTV